MNVPDEVVVWQKAYLAWGAEVHKKMSEARDLAYPHEQRIKHIITKYFKNRVPRTVLLYPTSMDGDAVCVSKSGLIFEGYNRGSLVDGANWQVIAGLVEEKDVVLRNLKDAGHRFLLRDVELFLSCFPKNVRFANSSIYLNQGFFGKPMVQVERHVQPFSFTQAGRDIFREIPFDGEEAKVFDSEVHKYSGDTKNFVETMKELGDGSYCRTNRDVVARGEMCRYVRRTPLGVVLGVRREVSEERVRLCDLSMLSTAVEFSRDSERVMAEFNERFEEYKAGMLKLGELLEAKFGRRMFADQL